MQALAEKLMAALPMYGRQLLALLLGPKSAVLAQDLESDSAVGQALTFLAVSFGIAFIAQIPFLPDKGNKELMFGVLAIQSALSFALNVAIVILAWRIVGARLAWKKVVVATCYFCGVSTILFLCVYLIAAGTFKALDPVGFQQVMSSTVADPLEMWNSNGYKAFWALIGVALIVSYAWIFCVWGGYRQLLQVTRLRSAVALSLFVVLSPLLLLVQLLIGATFAPSRTGPVVPTDLVGLWQRSLQTESHGIHSSEVLGYSFAAPESRMAPTGLYFMVKANSWAEGKCLIQSGQKEFGRLIVQGSSLTLVPQQRTQSAGNTCTGKSTEAPMNLSKTEYQFKVNQQPDGATLCLTVRFGQTCLSPRKGTP